MHDSWRLVNKSGVHVHSSVGRAYVLSMFVVGSPAHNYDFNAIAARKLGVPVKVVIAFANGFAGHHGPTGPLYNDEDEIFAYDFGYRWYRKVPQSP